MEKCRVPGICLIGGMGYSFWHGICSCIPSALPFWGLFCETSLSNTNRSKRFCVLMFLGVFFWFLFSLWVHLLVCDPHFMFLGDFDWICFAPISLSSLPLSFHLICWSSVCFSSSVLKWVLGFRWSVWVRKLSGLYIHRLVFDNRICSIRVNDLPAQESTAFDLLLLFT